jgi:pyrroloquinoline-quinone synthase
MGANERIRLNQSLKIVPLEEHWVDLIDDAWMARLDDTSFLRRCRSGDVSRDELLHFVGQQNLYSRHFTRYLCALLSNMAHEGDRLELTENLLEEIGFGDAGEIPHSQIYREMMAKLGVDASVAIEPATQHLIDTMYEACRNPNPLVGLAAMCLGAEAIVPHVYSQIIAGFVARGEPVENLHFFQLHVECDDGHAITMRKIIDRELGRNPEQIAILRTTAQRLIEARTLFFETFSPHFEYAVERGVKHESFQLQGF